MKSIRTLLTKKIVIGSAALLTAAGTIGVFALNGNEEIGPQMLETSIESLSANWPKVFETEKYVEPEFKDTVGRTNNAFNVKDFGEQGNNGWFYRFGSAAKPWESKQLEDFDGERYAGRGLKGLEIKNNFIHTSEAASSILEWRAAKNGQVNISLTYVKSVNNDKNPSYPDGVMLYVYKGEECLGRYDVDASTTKENLLEQRLEKVDVKELDSLYFVVDAKSNNAYDGGSLYVAINDVNHKGQSVQVDSGRVSNDANNVDDYGTQGQNGWTYLYGKSSKSAKLVSTFNNNEYMNETSPNLQMSQFFIHPAINDDAILAWTPAKDGNVEVRMKYTKFAQNDGNPNWPDGVIVSVFKNGDKLFTKKVAAPKKGENTISFREKILPVTTDDKLYFVVNAGGNSSYDGGSFDISILDRAVTANESDIIIDESETRQNFADVKYDFGEQGNNGWFYQEGYADEPFDAFNMSDYQKDEERYFDKSYLEIKRDFVNTGNGRSAIIKWKVAQTGTVKIESAYTKFKNEDKNPKWPDGTRVTIYHNNEPLISEDFEPLMDKEVTKRLDVSAVEVTKDDFITMVVNGKDNNAYDGGKYEFAIKGITPLTGNTEKDVVATYGSVRTNNGSAVEDFGKQGANGFCYQSGYNLDPFFAVNLETYQEKDKYTTKDGVEVKRDYIMPGNKGRSAIVKWVAKEEGSVDVMSSYTKLKNEDKNPNWPDGVTVFWMKNNAILAKEDFEPVTDKEVTKECIKRQIPVKAGDAITLMVDGKENTAYDGGKYTFVIEDSQMRTIPMVNNSEDNNANLKLDFTGEQGSNGWYYTEGRAVDIFEILQEKTDDGSGFKSRKAKNLEIKKDFIQPRLNANAMYKWVVAKDGKINIDAKYVKFGNEDPNADFPDGVGVKVYKNGSVLYDEICTCPRGEDRSVELEIKRNDLEVKRDDIITFEVNCNKNNAWDGGRFEADISDADELKVSIGDEERKNSTSLGSLDKIYQGADGWWFLEGNNLQEAKCLKRMNDDGSAFISAKHEGLEMKKDYVHPGEGAAAIYQWVVYEDGAIDIVGAYTKFGQNDPNPTYPDGVRLFVYKNESLLFEEKVDVFEGDVNDNKCDFMIEKMEVARGDKISFVINPEGNYAWDAGKLSVNIYDASKAGESDDERDNNTILKDDFGLQGENGWYYGMCDWDGKNFEFLPYDEENNRYYNNGKPELKADFVEPGNGRNAAYKWIAAKTGKVNVKGSYTKFANSADPEANGVCMRIFVNGEERKWLGGITQGNFDEEKVLYFDEEYAVHKDDEIMFAIDPDGNDSWDGGRLEVEIIDLDNPKVEEEETIPEEKANGAAEEEEEEESDESDSESEENTSEDSEENVEE